MKNIYILIFIGALIACSDKGTDKNQHNSNHKLDVVQTETNKSQSVVGENQENTDKTVKTKEADHSLVQILILPNGMVSMKILLSLNVRL